MKNFFVLMIVGLVLGLPFQSSRAEEIYGVLEEEDLFGV